MEKNDLIQEKKQEKVKVKISNPKLTWDCNSPIYFKKLRKSEKKERIEEKKKKKKVKVDDGFSVSHIIRQLY